MARKLARNSGTGSGRAVDDESIDESSSTDDDDTDDVQPDAVVRQEQAASEATEAGRSLLNRREYVKLSAAATAAVALTSGAGSAGTERHGIQFDRVLDAVDDLGMDPSGSSPIDRQIGDIPDNTLVEFPDGVYLFTGRNDITRMGSIGFYGKGDATLKTAANTNTYHLNIASTDNILLEGFTIDQTADNCCYAYRLHAREQLYVGDLEVVGRGIRDNADGTIGLNLSITEPDGFGLVERWIDKKGSTWAAYNSGAGRIGSYSGQNHVGTLRFVDCDLREFGNNALYSSRTGSTGNIQVEDSYFENNNAGNIRISGEGSYVDNCTIVISEDRYTGPRDSHHESESFALRPIVLEQRTDDENRSKEAGVEIRNTEIRIEPAPAAYPPIHAYPNSRSVLVENCHIEVNGSIRSGTPSAQTALVQRAEYRHALGGNYPPGEPPRWLRMYDTTITGTVEGIDTAVFVADGDGTVLEDCWIELDTDANGITIVDSEDCSVENTNVVVGNNATVFDNSDVTTRNITHDADETHGDDSDEEDDVTDAPDDDGWHSFVIDGFDPDTWGEYEFIVDGEARENDELSVYGSVGTIESTEDGTTRVAGTMRSGADAFDYQGAIVEYTADSDMIFVRDGVELDRDEVVDGENEPGDDETEEEDDGTNDGDDETNDDIDSELDHLLRIVAEEDARIFEYELIVDGDAELHTEGEYAATPIEESLSGIGEAVHENDDGTVSLTGALANGRGDSFTFTGELIDVTLGGPATVTVDGDDVPLEQYDLEHSLEIVGTGDTANYEFTIDGELIADPFCESSCADAISGTNAEDAVTTETASFQFDGEISDFSIDGLAAVYLNGRQVDPNLLTTDQDPFLTNWITVDGLGEETTYQFAVSDDVYKAPDLGPVDADDTISDGMVIGSVAEGVDGYRFTGDLTMLRVQGTADVQFDDEP